MEYSNGPMAATITKEELASLPMASFTGTALLIDSVEEADKAVEFLRSYGMLGFDTETKPSFKKGQTNNVALLQLSTVDTCFLFRLNHIGLPDSLKDLLEDNNILKIGVSIHDDFHNLRKIYNIEPAGFIDLQSFVKKYCIADNSLARIYGILFGLRISKGQRLSNWEAPELTNFQQAYAALDAAACVEIYQYLLTGRFDPESSIYWRDTTPKESKEKE